MKRIGIWFLLIASILLSVNLARSVYDLSKRESVLHEARDQLSQTKEKNEKLNSELEYVQSPAYIEQQARDKLNLAKPDETVLILPEVTPPPEEKEEVELPVWKQWMEVFRIEI